MNKETAAEGIDRRAFIKIAGISATGYALAVQPLSAETLHTPETGLVTRDIEVARGADRIPVYLAMPEGSARRPVVIVIHEIFGQHEHIRDVARRFAREGFIAAAPELYFRAGGVKHLKEFPEILKVVGNTPDRQMLDDLGALLTYLKGLPQSSGKVGATGFCWGGGATWLLALDNPQLDAAVAWYGRLSSWGSGELHPHNPMDLAEHLHAPVLGLYGGKDNGIPVADVYAMRDKLKALGKTNEMVIYPDAPHAFHADYRPSYRSEAAQDGWQRCVAWLRKYLA